MPVGSVAKTSNTPTSKYVVVTVVPARKTVGAPVEVRMAAEA
nr:hypothetical protein [Hymenobacter sp. 5516J-16]